MTNTISSLKKKNSSSTDKLKKAIEQLKTNAVQKDDRFWQPEVDKAGNGYAVIRFLDTPHVDGDEGLPYVRIWSHGFQGPGGWYIENSLTTLNLPDPVSEYNSILWNSGVEANKKIARDQKRKLNYISNILVINDSAHPENNGKVFLFKYGKKIFAKIDELLNPQFQDEESINPFDFWEGANFKLKIRNLEGYRNYDKSEFDKPSPVASSDEEIEKLWKKEHSLLELVSSANFKTYDQLKDRLDKVLGNGKTVNTEHTVATEPVAETPAMPLDVDSDDEDMLNFAKLANE